MAMALRAAAAVTTRHPPPPRSSPKPPPRLSPPAPPLLSPAPATAALSLLSALSSTAFCGEAKAISFSKDDIVSSLTKVEETANQVGDAGAKALDFSQSILKVLTDALQPALPVLRGAGEEALKIASPVVSDVSRQAKEALQSAGVDTAPVISAAKTVADAAQQTTKVIEGAKPLASATVETISSSDPSVIVVSAGALFLAYLLLPSLWSVVSYNFRGFKGSLSPAQTLDLISTQNYLVVDIRSEKDKNKAGVPRLPSSAKNKMISVPLEELPSKLKGLVKNVKKVEAEIVALKISYLKKVNKGSDIIIMDSYADNAKIVAKALTGLGFKNCYIMADGFSGGKGWSQSRLGTDSYNVSITELLSPSRVIPAAAARFGTTSSASTRRLLPGSSDN